MSLKIKLDPAIEGTQTHLDESIPSAEAVYKASEAYTKTPNEETKAAFKKSFEDYNADAEKTYTERATKTAQQKAEKEQAQKLVEEFKAKKLTAPAGSLVSPEKLEKIQKYAVEQGLNEKQALDLVNMENQILVDYEAVKTKQLEARKAEFAQENEKNPKLGGAAKNRADQLINALIKAKGDAELEKLFKEYPASQHPKFREFLLNIAEGMDAGELQMGGSAAITGEEEAPWRKEFAATHAAAVKAGVVK